MKMTDHSLYHLPLVDESRCDGGQFFISLVNLGAETGYLTDCDIERLQCESVEILKTLAAKLTKEKSSSIRNETAQKLVSSVYYTVGVYLKTLSPVGAALKEIKNKTLSELFDSGTKAVKQLVSHAKNLKTILDKNPFKTKNTFYSGTVKKGLDAFFSLYNADFFADETHITADYPVFVPINSLTGIEFIDLYIERLTFENSFCSFFSPDDIDLLLTASYGNYRDAAVNIYSHVLIGSLFSAASGSSCTQIIYPSENAVRVISGKNREELLRVFTQTAKKLFLQFDFSDKLKEYVLMSLPYAVDTVINARVLGTLNTLFPSGAAVHEKAPIIVTEGEMLTQTEYSELLDKIDRAEQGEERAAVIINGVKSFSDLFDIIRDSQADKKTLVCLFGELPEYALSQLIRQYPDEDLLSDERDKEIYNTLRAFLSALPPEKLVRIMNGAAD